MDTVSMSYLFSFSRYQTKCIIKFLFRQLKTNFNPIQDGHFRGCSRMAGGGRGGKKTLLPKICHTDPTIMKLGTVIPYPKKTQKYMNHVTHPLSFADISIFSPGIGKFCYINKCDIDCILIHNFYLF